jgi:hypothetical protein
MIRIKCYTETEGDLFVRSIKALYESAQQSVPTEEENSFYRSTKFQAYRDINVPSKSKGKISGTGFGIAM